MSSPDNPYLPPHEPRLPADGVAPRAGATRVRYLVLAALCLAALVSYVQRNSIGVAEERMRLELGVSKEEMGWMFSAFFLPYALLQIPSGLFGQLVGSRRGLSLVMGFSSAVCAATALAVNLPALLATRIGMGAAQAGVFPCSIPTIRHWIPEARRSLATGLLGGFMSVGGALGTFAMGALLPVVGWRMAFLVFALPGFAFAFGFYAWFRERPQEHGGVNEQELAIIRRAAGRKRDEENATSLAEDRPGRENHFAEKVPKKPAKPKPASEVDGLAAPMTAPQKLHAGFAIGALCGQQVFRAAGQMFFSSWFATFLRDTRGVGDLEVGVLNSLPLLALVAGSPLGGVLGDWLLAETGSRRLARQGVAVVGMLACSGLVLCAYSVTGAWPAVLLISAGSFFSAFGGPSAYAATIDMGGRHAPTVFSTMNMMGNLGAFAFPILVPRLLKVGVPKDASNWNLVLLTFAAMYAAAAVCWLLADANATVDRKPA